MSLLQAAFGLLLVSGAHFLRDRVADLLTRGPLDRDGADGADPEAGPGRYGALDGFEPVAALFVDLGLGRRDEPSWGARVRSRLTLKIEPMTVLR